MATAQVTISDQLAAALGELDEPLEADSVAFEQVLRLAIYRAGDDLRDLSELVDRPEPRELRRLGARLEVLAVAYEAVA